MKQSIISFLFDLGDAQVFSFQCGYLTGVAASLAVLLLLLLLYALLRGPVKAPGVRLTAPHGTLFVSATAIADLVNSLEGEFPDIQITKVALYEKKKELRLYVRANHPPQTRDDSLLATAGVFQARVISDLKNIFGIETITRIDIDVKRGKLQ